MLADSEPLFRRLDREIWIISTKSDDRLGGLVSTTVTQASIVRSMPRVLLTLAKTHQTTELVQASRTFAAQLVSVSHADMVWRFGLQSGRDTDKWSDIAFQLSELGNPILDCHAGWIDCRVEEMFDIGDRWVVLGDITNAQNRQDAETLKISDLLDVSTAEQLAKLRDFIEQDAAIDAQAIDQWRRTRHSS